MQDDIVIFTGSASTRLGAAECHALQLTAGLHEYRRFPDGEVQIELNQYERRVMTLIPIHMAKWWSSTPLRAMA